jgi:hypothetical protein
VSDELFRYDQTARQADGKQIDPETCEVCMFSAFKPSALFVRNRRGDEWVDEADLPEAVAAALYARLRREDRRCPKPITEIVAAMDAHKIDMHGVEDRDVDPVDGGTSTAQHWEGWLTATPEKQEAMRQAYRDRIRADQEASRKIQARPRSVAGSLDALPSNRRTAR